LVRPLDKGETLVVASHNQGKVREIDELIAPFGFIAVAAGSLGLAEPDETGATFEDNARLKSQAAAISSGLPALADDSGLVVDALDGEPGIYSARWAGPDKDFSRAMRLVEERLHAAGATDPKRRTARFVAVLSLAFPDGTSEEFRGEVEGTLVWPPRGDRGFGYDPMFLPEGHDRTFGEMEAEAKHGLNGKGEGLSHRARAFARFARARLAAP
jgi:XTP/dITP diphosphohydrolase